MTYPMSRSANAELAAGMSDGTFKKVTRDRGGIVEPLTAKTRDDLDDYYYGIHEKPASSRTLPDGTSRPTEYVFPTHAIDNTTF